VAGRAGEAGALKAYRKFSSTPALACSRRAGWRLPGWCGGRSYIERVQGEADACWRELDAAATRLIAQLQPIIPTHVSWTVRPSRDRSILKWRVEDRLIFERDFGGPVVEIYEPIRRRPVHGGPWASVATPDQAAARLLSGLTAAVHDGDFDE
jgi:hypothetical protein